MTICFVIIGLDYAGAEIQLVEVIRHLRRRGWRIFVISVITPAAFVQELAGIGVRVISLDHAQGSGLSPRMILRFLAALHRIRPDIVHGHMVHSNLLARLGRLVWGIPVAIATVHSTDEGGRSRTWLYRLTEPLGTLTTSVSPAGRDKHIATRASRADRIRVLPNGIDTDRFRPDPEARARIRSAMATPADRFVWLCVARFHPPKDHETLLLALQATEAAEVELWLVGQGSLQAAVEARVKALGLEDRVRFLGVRTDVEALLAASDGFVLSSTSEAMPITLLEAGSAGVPCVTSDVGAAAELVVHERTGFVVPPSDAAALAAAMKRLQALTPESRRAFGVAARRHVEGAWSLSAVVDRWEALYHEALAAIGR